MGYDIALNKAWGELEELSPKKIISVKFLGDEYSVDIGLKKVMSLSCNVPAKDFTAILILHYLVSSIKGLPQLSGEWVSFKELSGIEGYYPAFRLRAIEPIIRKYGQNPEAILAVQERLPAKKVNQGDVGLVVEVFAGVAVIITLWKGDSEFGPEANMLFDKNISRIFCTEDIVVLAGLLAGQL